MKKVILPLGIIVLVMIAGLSLFKNKQANNPSTSSTEVLLEDTTPPPGSSTLGIFEGRTPCKDFLLEFTNDPVPGCEKIKWLITLYQDSKTSNPTRYVFGVQGRIDSHEGNWNILSGTKSNPNATLYQLQPDKTGQTISLLKVDDNHLFFLDSDGDFLVGDALWSYTLSRTE